MKETILAFAKGKINIDEAKLVFQPGYISEFIEPDSVMQGSFNLTYEGNRKIKGCIFSTNRRMKPIRDKFHADNTEIRYTFTGTGMREGDIIQGDFIILSEAGEYRIPFTVTAQQNTIVTGQGRLRNLETFSAVASADREEAYRAFCKHRFLNTLKNEDSRFTTLYKGLTRDGFSYDAMDEFLTAIRNSDSSYDEAGGSWNGRRKTGISNQEKLIEKDRIVCLYELFLDFRCMKTSTKAWIIKTRALLSEQMGMKNDSGFYSLYYVHTLLIEGKTDEAKEKLDEVMDTISGISNNPRLYAYYLYLCALINMTETLISLNCKRIWELFKKNNKDPFILWILFMVEKEFLENSQLKCSMAKSLYEKGVVSPLINMEIALLFRRNPELCTELSEFNIQVLLFAARNHLMTPELCSMVFRMSTRSNVFKSKVYLLLVQCYEELKDKESLQTICHYLIRNDKEDNRYFKWFELGVEQDLRIARLYDYYLYSVKEDMQRPLPEKVLEYFKFNMEIEYNKKSFLFANLYRFKDELPLLYEEYREDMELFVMQQLQLGRINRHLAYLYSELVDDSLINQENAGQVADLLFSYHATNLPSWANSVVVTDSMFITENEFPIINGEAVVYLYSDNSCILLKDGERKRFVKNAGKWEKWFYNSEILKLCETYCPNHQGIVLRRCDRLVKGKDPNWEESVQEIINNSQMTSFGKESILQSLFDYFYEHADKEALEKMIKLRADQPEYLRTGNNLLSSFLLLGYYEEALEYSITNGCEHILPSNLVTMCDYAISKLEFEYSKELYDLTAEIFKRGKYSERMLKYLVMFAEGENDFLMKLLNAVRAFDLDVSSLEEKLLIQSLFVGQVPDILFDVFYHYHIHGGRTVVKNAFLSFVAHEIITKNRVLEPDFVNWLDDRMKRGHIVTDVCKILWLRSYAEGIVDQPETAEEIIDEFEQKDKFFEFYKKLPKRLQNKYFITNKAIIECKANKNAEVNCFYALGDSDKFTRKHMAEVYDGVYATMIPLFAKECLQYYVTVETEDDAYIISSNRITKDVFEGDAKTRYEWVDRILSAESYDEMDSRVLDFLREDLLSSKLFVKH